MTFAWVDSSSWFRFLVQSYIYFLKEALEQPCRNLDTDEDILLVPPPPPLLQDIKRTGGRNRNMA